MKSKLLKILLAIVLSLVLAVGALLGRQTSVFVCRHCGASAAESEWQIPFTSFALLRESRHIVSSPLSATLASLALVDAAAPHDWVLAHVVGNGLSSGLGVGGSMWACSRSERVAELIRASHTSGDTAFRDQLLHCIFQRDTAPVVHTLAESAPANAFSDASAFAAWRAEQAKLMQKLFTLIRLTMRWSEPPPALRLQFPWLQPVHCNPCSVSAAVAYLVLVRG